MGSSTTGRLPSFRSGGDVKPQLSRCFFRYTMMLAATFILTLGLLGWTQPLDVQTVAVNWKTSTGSLFGLNQNMTTRLEEASQEILRQRGVGLLHAWTDSELFEKVLLRERVRDEEGLSESGRKKIAFMFLVQHGVPLAPLWNKFFKGHERLYNVYVHMWPLRLSAIQVQKGAFFGRLIPSEDGGRLTPGLIADARRLLANAILDDANNEWFALVSESCIPIHGFRYVYHSLASTSQTYMEVSANHWDMPNRYKARGDDAMMPEISFSQFRVGSQFWVMRKKHALMAVGDTLFWNKFNRPCLDQYHNCFPEEHYFPTLMNIMDPGGTTAPVTLVDWSQMARGGHPRRFVGNEINRTLIRNLQERKDGYFLFARKFDEDCLKPLLEISDAILDR